MTIEEILNITDSSTEDIVELCSKLVQIPTPNPPGNTESCIKFIEEYFKELKIPTKIYRRKEGKANIVAKVEGESSTKILWLGHIDVVPKGNPDFWKHDPYGGDVEGEFVFGRGSSDMKGSCASAMIAAKTLHESSKPPNTVEFWFTCDEEIGGREGAQWLAQDGLIKGDVCIIGDSSGSTPKKPYVDIGCKGLLWTKLKVDGKTAHGSTPYLGDNAIEKLLAVIERVKQIGDHELEIPEDLKSVLRSSVDFLLVNPELNDNQQEAARRLYEFPTVSLNILQGGVKINVVPDSADAAIDIRFTPGIDIDTLKKRVVDLIKSSNEEGITYEFQIGTGYYESPKSIFVKQLSNVVNKATKSTPNLKILTGGTDAISLKNFQGVPCLGFGSGLKGQAHTPDEHVSIENLVMASKVYTLFPLLYKP